MVVEPPCTADLRVCVLAGDSKSTIVVPWFMGNAQEIMDRGHRAIAAYKNNHYLDYDSKAHPISSFWYDVAAPRDGKGNGPFLLMFLGSQGNGNHWVIPLEDRYHASIRVLFLNCLI